MNHIYSIEATTDNNLRGLQRIIGLFAKRYITVKKINSYEDKNASSFCFNFILHCEAKDMEVTFKQIQKIYELRNITITIQNHVFQTEMKESVLWQQ